MTDSRTLLTYGPGMYDVVLESFDEVHAAMRPQGTTRFPIFTRVDNGKRIAVNPALVTRVSEA